MRNLKNLGKDGGFDKPDEHFFCGKGIMVLSVKWTGGAWYFLIAGIGEFGADWEGGTEMAGCLAEDAEDKGWVKETFRSAL